MHAAMAAARQLFAVLVQLQIPPFLHDMCAFMTASRLAAHSDFASNPVCSAVAAVAERQLQTPHGGELVDLMAPAGEHAALKAACTKSIELSDRNACDVELLTVGWDFRLLFSAWLSLSF